MRGFEHVVIDGVVTTTGTIPRRQTLKSAGYDIVTPRDVMIGAKSTIIVWTNIKAYMGDDEFLDVRIRSSIGGKGIILRNQTGVIDSDYYSNPKNDGDIGLALYNDTTHAVALHKGDRIAQGIFTKFLLADNDNPVAERVGGYGSTK